MHDQTRQPAFGTADLSNCERELIHLAGSVQPHGVLLVLQEPTFTILQVSSNCLALLGATPAQLLGTTLERWSSEVTDALRRLLTSEALQRPTPMRCALTRGATTIWLEGMVHRAEYQGLVVELEPVEVDGEDRERETLPRQLHSIIAQITAATSVDSLCHVLAAELRPLLGYDRVMVYRFDPDGHGEVVAEAREPQLESYLGLHYPASDIPQRARELYLRNRVRVLADTAAVSAPLEPRLSPLTRSDLDMSMSYLRSLSPIHIEYLRNMGVTGTLVASLVKDGDLWGLISCHHYSPRRLRYQVRAACELLADVFSTRLAALDAQTVAQSVLLVPQLEEQIVETASLTGDWHQALFGALRALLLPLNASGAALIYEGQTLTTGLVPASEDLSRLAAWIAEESSGHVFQSAAIGKRESSFARLATVASGVLALRLTPTRLDYMLWFRREQLQTVRWAGDPSKAVMGDDPNHLSPRRSFAVWTEQVRHSAQHWSAQEQALAHVLQTSIADTIQQVQGIRVLIAARQLASVTRMVERAGEPMALFNERDQVLLLNQPMRRLLALEGGEVESLEQLAGHFTEPGTLVDAVRQLRRAPRPWTGELAILSRGAEIAMAVRADAVPSAEGGILGTMVVLTDLSERREAEAARRRLVHALEARPRGEEALSPPLGDNEFGRMMEAVLENAKLAVHSVGGPDAGAVHGTAFRSIEVLTRRAAALARQMLAFASQPPRKG